VYVVSALDTSYLSLMTSMTLEMSNKNAIHMQDGNQHREPARLTLDFLRSHGVEDVDGALVLGSGWAPLIDQINVTSRWSYRDIPGMPETSVAGHPGDLVIGSWADTPIIAFVGRWHAYEGRTPNELGLPALLAKALAARWLLCTNASGGIDPHLEVGDLVLVADDFGTWSSNNLLHSALRNAPDEKGGAVYSRELSSALLKAGLQTKVPLRIGSLAMMPGANYESAAEIGMLRKAGVSIVSMSTVPEARTAHTIGLPVVAISCVTNRAPSSLHEPLDHDQVLAILEHSRDDAARLIGAWLELI
jgi:purine-nucleoside phosphorylase